MSDNSPSTLDEASLHSAAGVLIFDSRGQPVEFGSLLKEPVIVVFIRHFFCGSCQQYVAQLSSVRAEALSKAKRQLIIVGCGSYEAIAAYKEITSCPFAIYADPKRELYRALGMTYETLALTPANEKRRSYLQRGLLGNVLRSIWTGPLKNLSLIGKQGNISQLGGEFVFDSDVTCIFAHRMKHSEDHTEISELMQVAGVEYP
ncbi:AhpC/TSA antioxidant enzyme-domain-containing protein [Pisolithus croceorrhizus]|nr:AhpC/TSA antioxidant enzyme-domain-containing protein [Pisolithus croceorrhizus]KAI6152750.1 AhpC/TSA antioxidant enzyme-domain-containing protein [Pisolithus thermaeus]